MTFETILTAQTIDEYTAAGYWSNRTITDFLDEAVARTPDKIAAIDSRRQLTYRELQAETDRCASGLLELGVQSGDVVSFQLPNWIEFLVLHFAATRIGAVSNPLIPIYRDREIGFMVGFAESKVLVIPRTFRKFDYPAMADRLRPSWPALQHVFVVDGQPGDANPSWESFMDTPWEQRRDPAELTAARPDPNDVTLLMFTSGTTGEPKGVMHTHNTLVAAIAPLPERLGVSSDSVIHMASTVAHLTGLLYGVRLQTQLGATGVYQDVWSNEQFVELIEKHRITLHLGSDAVPARHAERAEHRRARRVLAGPVLLLRRPDPAGHRPAGQAAVARVGRCQRLGSDRGRPGHARHPRRPGAEGHRAGRLPVARDADPGRRRRRHRTAGRHRRPPAGDRAVPVRRVRQTAGDDPGVVRRSVVRHRRYRPHRRRRLSADLRSHQGRHHPRRGEHPGRLRGERALREPEDRRPSRSSAFRIPGCRNGPARASSSSPGCRSSPSPRCSNSSARRAWPGSTGRSAWK